MMGIALVFNGNAMGGEADIQMIATLRILTGAIRKDLAQVIKEDAAGIGHLKLAGTERAAPAQYGAVGDPVLPGMAGIKVTAPPDLLISSWKAELRPQASVLYVVPLPRDLRVTGGQVIQRRDLSLAAEGTELTATAPHTFGGTDSVTDAGSPPVPALLAVPVNLLMGDRTVLRRSMVLIEIPLLEEFRIFLCPVIHPPKNPAVTGGTVE